MTNLLQKYRNNSNTSNSLVDKYKSSPQENFQDHSQQEESSLKSAIRYASQIPLGLASTTGPGIAAGIWELLATGDVLDPEEIEHIKMISEREGIPFDEESYMKAAHTALGAIPTVSNISNYIEKKTGAPITPKTRGQKALRFFTESSRLAPKKTTFKGLNTELPKPILGTGITATKEGLQEAGVPEPISEIASFGILKSTPKGSPSISIGKNRKPSGLTTRKYEDIKKPTSVSKNKISEINQAVEDEFRNIASDIIEKSPINETYQNLKNNSQFKNQARESFKDVQKIAESIPDNFSTSSVRRKLKQRFSNKEISGITPSEYDRYFKKFIREFIKNTPITDINNSKLVSQYRKNNAAYAETLEPGKSRAYNRAKRDALLEYNKSISDVISQKYPNTEYSNLFHSTNEKWSKIMDAETIDKFLDDMFKGKINFNKGKNLIEKEGMQQPFKRALGEKGFKDFDQLVKDLMTTEQANKMLKVAEKKGYSDVAKSMMAYVLNPKIAITKVGYDISKLAYTNLWESLLANPKLAVKWDKGIKEFKKGRFKEANEIFQDLKNQSK